MMGIKKCGNIAINWENSQNKMNFPCKYLK